MILTKWIRLIRDAGSTLTDISLSGQSDDTILMDITASTDYVYIGQYWPFNNIYFNINTVNSETSAMSVDFWNGNSWEAAIDVIDGTSVSGASLARTGVVQWTIARQSSFAFAEDTDVIPELTSLNIYNLYWVRIKFNNDLTAETALNRINYAFTAESFLERIDSQIDDYLTAWESGKTDWWEQVEIASNHVLSDLKAMGVVFTRGQIHNFEDISMATAYRTLALIYNELGESHMDKKESAMKEYYRLLSKKRFDIDNAADGRLDRHDLESKRVGLIR